ncbi:hypothetical protein [Paenibacillus woosongensis]|uniref:Thioredoxin domain-containing protein n=1 Tax=Paenibacillus woosongensis TaxID=307580 RepID=A0ABQ4MX01_9BACL|nr:hypothetical protein [Paenibacillus woosongensis]GIP60449.1 hypothetical protein J15TS10_42630 [Paenibacillus woosongensis]
MQSQLALWMLLSIQTVLLCTLALQFRKHKNGGGLPPGMRIPNVPVEAANDTQYLRSIAKENNITFILLASGGCKFCVAVLKELSKQYNDQMIPIRILYYGKKDETIDIPSEIPVYQIRKEMTSLLKVNKFPFGLILDQKSVILRRDIVSVQQLESWLKAQRENFPEFTGE